MSTDQILVFANKLWNHQPVGRNMLAYHLISNYLATDETLFAETWPTFILVILFTAMKGTNF